jgi:hypothetical protein
MENVILNVSILEALHTSHVADELFVYAENTFECESIRRYHSACTDRPGVSDSMLFLAGIEYIPHAQGERNETAPVQYAHKLAEDLVNAEGGAIVYTVKGRTLQNLALL